LYRVARKLVNGPEGLEFHRILARLPGSAYSLPCHSGEYVLKSMMKGQIVLLFMSIHLQGLVIASSFVNQSRVRFLS